MRHLTRPPLGPFGVYGVLNFWGITDFWKVGRNYMPAVPRPLSPQVEAVVNRALEVLQERNVKNDYCPRCNTSDWYVEINAIPAMALSASGTGGWIASGPSSGYIPVLTVVCKNCGYTMFHNLNVLEIPT